VPQNKKQIEAVMVVKSIPLTIAICGSFVLSACVDELPTTGSKTKDFAIAGAAVGGLFGLTRPNGSRVGNAAVGAAIGAAAGGVIGQMLDRQAADLSAKMGNDNVDIVNTGSELIVTLPQDLLFDVGSDDIRLDQRADLAALADSLMENPDSTVDVLGHTDNIGSATSNQELSARRAQAVHAILQNEGVAPSRLRAFGRGEDEPVASNLNESGRAENRRVEIVIRPIT
jgi:outer membrane protein OmpA-like peptidoglycan-associated protein